MTTFKRIAFEFIVHPLWRLFDALCPKRSDYWAFSTHHLHTGRFIESQRALFEHLKRDKKIRKIIFFRGKREDFHIEDAINYDIVRHGSLRGFWLLGRCKVVLLTHSISMEYSIRWKGREFSIMKLALYNRVVVHMSHGISLKRLLAASNTSTRQHTDRVPYRRHERSHYTGMLATSDVDSYAMASMFQPIPYDRLWITGTPRSDFLIKEESDLPSYIRKSISQIESLKNGQKLVLYAPTYRQTDVSTGAYYYQFSEAEIEKLKSLLRSNNAILGYRPHYFKNSEKFFNMDAFIDGDRILDFSQTAVPEISAALRACDVLITDYSSVYVDAIYLRKRVIGFTYDIAHYQTHQDGLLYDMELTFEGPTHERFECVLSSLQEALTESEPMPETSFQLKFFYKYRDAMNSERVTAAILKSLQRNVDPAT